MHHIIMSNKGDALKARASLLIKTSQRSGAHDGKIRDEMERCFVYDPEGECRGATGRKFRQVCVYCPMYERHYKKKEKERKENEKGS